MDQVYDVAVSYASEQRYYVEPFVKYLKKKGLHVYYDRDEQIMMLGSLLHEKLSEIYSTNSMDRVIFLSHDYTRKPFTVFESEIILAENVFEKGRLYVFKFDDATLPGLNRNMVYASSSEFPLPEEFARLVYAKLKGNEKATRERSLFSRLKNLISQSVNLYCRSHYPLLPEYEAGSQYITYRIRDQKAIRTFLHLHHHVDTDRIDCWLYATEPKDKQNSFNGYLEEIQMSNGTSCFRIHNLGLLDALQMDIDFPKLSDFVDAIIYKMDQLVGL